MSIFIYYPVPIISLSAHSSLDGANSYLLTCIPDKYLSLTIELYFHFHTWIQAYCKGQMIIWFFCIFVMLTSFPSLPSSLNPPSFLHYLVPSIFPKQS